MRSRGGSNCCSVSNMQEETSSAWTSGEVAAHTIQNPPGASIDGAHPNALGAMKIARVLYKSVCDVSYLACTSHY